MTRPEVNDARRFPPSLKPEIRPNKHAATSGATASRLNRGHRSRARTSTQGRASQSPHVSAGRAQGAPGEQECGDGNTIDLRTVQAPLKEKYRSVDSTPFEQLDYLYTPCNDVAADVRYFTEVLGGRLVFAVEGMGARVALVELTSGPPHVLLTDHLEGDRPIYIYRVEDLRKATAELKRRGLKKQRALEIPMGLCSSFVTPTGHRIALYELARPGVLEHFMGRRDF
jgi:hypothetical protein